MDITEQLLLSEGTLMTTPMTTPLMTTPIMTTPVDVTQGMDQNQEHDGSGDMELEQWYDVPEKEDNENHEHDVTHSVPNASTVDPQITTHNVLKTNGHEKPQDIDQPCPIFLY